MKVKEMVVKRLKDICKERGITPNSLANISGVTPSTVYSLMDSNKEDVFINTIKKLCDGLDITLSEFFSTEEFNNLQKELE